MSNNIFKIHNFAYPPVHQNGGTSVWSYLKIADLANVACDFLSELDVLIQRAKKRMQRKPDLIQAFILDAGYEV